MPSFGTHWTAPAGLDEAQRIKTWATKSSVYVKTLLRLVLTGTPMEYRLEELASLLDWWTTSRSRPA